MHGIAEAVIYPKTERLVGGLSAFIAGTCDQVIYDDIFEECEYAPAFFYASEHRSRPSLNVVDLGMNLGYFTIYLMDRLKYLETPYRIWGVEAVPEIAAECKRRLANQPGIENVSIHTGMIGKREGHAGMQISLSHPCNSIVHGSRALASDTKEVRLMKFFDLLSIPDFPEHIDLLKVDIEGAEEMFCESYPEVLTRSNAVVMEMHFEKCNTAACCEALERAGLTTVQTLNRKDNTYLALYTRPAC